ncbi:MAG: TIGR00725 family protein [Desulfobacterales bacterium]|nr:TIGR00725 family protein [Desulfobacterales bacterium]MDD4071799.1 TIGR00725 family protein [Desulfobacterales bacterium]MDD4393403.1 TIGR00725 family protein [Desulfobacterales bacterium]
MKTSLIIGVMGGGTASAEEIEAAYLLGSLIAKQGWILLNGGRNTGIMDASAKGAWDEGGLTIGILPDNNYSRMSEYIKIPVLTGMGDARNMINVLSSHILVACPGQAGTISEIALSLKNHRKVILMNFETGTIFNDYLKQGLISCVKTPGEVIEKIKEMIA